MTRPASGHHQQYRDIQARMARTLYANFAQDLCHSAL